MTTDVEKIAKFQKVIHEVSTLVKDWNQFVTIVVNCNIPWSRVDRYRAELKLVQPTLFAVLINHPDFRGDKLRSFHKLYTALRKIQGAFRKIGKGEIVEKKFEEFYNWWIHAEEDD